MLLSLMITGALAAEPVGPCAEPAGVMDFLGAANQGEQAFAAMDLEGLTRARDSGLSIIPCLSEPITTVEAAAFHRMMAMEAFTADNQELVLSEFHAARRLQPGYQIPASVADADHPMVILYEQSIAAGEGEYEPTIPPKGGFVNVDGVRGAPRPNGISVIAQVFEADASLTETVFLRPGDTMPNWGPLPIDELQRKRRRVLLTGSAGTTGVATAVLYGLAWSSYRTFWDEDDPLPDAELPGQQVRTNGLLLAGTGTGVASLALGTGAIITW